MNREKYYNNEIPVEVETADGVIAYYPNAKKLHISFPAWTDSYGVKRRGKTVSFPVDKFKDNEQAKEILNMVIADL